MGSEEYWSLSEKTNQPRKKEEDRKERKNKESGRGTKE